MTHEITCTRADTPRRDQFVGHHARHRLVGSLLLGWGLFNAIEGVIDHQILGIHHVHPGTDQLAWDLAFIASGLVMMAIGWATIRAGRT